MNYFVSLPKSSKQIYSVLKKQGSVSFYQLQKHTNIPKRTMFYALSKLKQKGIVAETYSFLDMRNRKYSIIC